MWHIAETVVPKCRTTLGSVVVAAPRASRLRRPGPPRASASLSRLSSLSRLRRPGRRLRGRLSRAEGAWQSAQGASQPPQGAWQPAEANRGAARPRPNFSLSKLRPGDLIAGGGSLLLLIALFLPWYTAHESPATRTPSLADVSRLESLAVAICGGRSACLNSSAKSISISALHGGAGGWRVLILILALVTLVYLLVRAFLPSEPRLPVQHWQIVTALTGVTAVLALIALLANPLSIFNGFGATAGLGIGAIIGLIVALAAVVGGVLLRAQAPQPGPTPA